MTLDSHDKIDDADTVVSGFVDGTHVQTESGFSEIQFLSVGDLVLSRCEVTGKLSPRKISRCLARSSEDVFYVVTQSDIAGTDTIGTAAQHLFWVQGRGWVEARLLSAGDLLEASVGVRTVVQSTREAGYRTALLKIEIEGEQAYFTGNHGVRVRNAHNVV